MDYDINDQQSIEDFFNKYKNNSVQILVNKIQLGMIRTEKEAKIRAPSDRGFLRTSINSKTTLKGTNIIGEVGTNKFYGKIIHDGAKSDKQGKALGEKYFVPIRDKSGNIINKGLHRWMKRHGFEVDGIKGKDGYIQKPMVGLMVHHPGNPFLKDAFDIGIGAMKADLIKLFAKEG